ncbi:MAG: baseplate J/gp47 family protein [Spirulina sp.]
MIDPGFPFSDTHSYQSLIESLEDQLRLGVEQPAQHTFVVNANATYEFPQTVEAIQEVRENKLIQPRIFLPDEDYRLVNQRRLVWQNPPADGTRLIVRYTYRELPAGLTDFNPGSVVGTLVRAFARELKLLYGQMDEAYRRAFIDTAEGVALDNVVRLLDVERKRAEKAQGHVVFTRKDTTQAVTIPQGTRLADTQSQEFLTRHNTLFPAGETTLAVAIEAATPGPAGNVAAHTITIMPTPLPALGSVEVTNPNRLQGGQNPEADGPLRERAKFAVERSGNATLNAIKYAVLELEGVDEVDVLDQSMDAAIPLGEIRVRYASDHNTPELQRAVESVVQDTRAAGILAQVGSISRILVSGSFYLIPESGLVEGAPNRFMQQVQQTINGLAIGEPLSVRRLMALVYGIPGLAEVADAQLDAIRDGSPAAITDPWLTAPTELLRVGDVTVKLLTGLSVTQSVREGTDNKITLQVLEPPETPVLFRNFTLDLSLTFMATLRRAPDQPPERFLTLPQSLSFRNHRNRTLTLPDSALLFNPETGRGFRPNDHAATVTVTLSAAAYPGLATTTTTITLPITP